MVIRRVNTLTLNFKNVRKKPSNTNLHMWIKNVLKCTVDQIVGIQFDHVKHKIFLKLVSNWQMQAILQKFKDGIVKYVEDGEEFDVYITEDTDDILIKIFDFPLELENNKIKEKMSQYGVVRSMRNEKYAGEGLFNVETGIRSMWISMKKPIPSYITIEGCTSLITYANQVRTCMICEEPGHERKDCPRRITNRINEIRRPSAPVVTMISSEILQQESTDSQLEIPETQLTPAIDVIVNNEEVHHEEEEKEKSEESLDSELESDTIGDIISPTQKWQEVKTKNTGLKKKKREEMETSSEEERKVPKLTIKLPPKAGRSSNGNEKPHVENFGNIDIGERSRGKDPFF
ncbi:unnamed protein product [Phaedon cochleariae]|uniref:CCHC-type domain-containing protein n=1 Tax=Phaedon cochleariae TaxID=80249 RepID=A0A9N9X4J8_PHACE|nr:unnamed protein product [Phaedon cochleariae]